MMVMKQFLPCSVRFLRAIVAFVVLLFSPWVNLGLSTTTVVAAGAPTNVVFLPVLVKGLLPVLNPVVLVVSLPFSAPANNPQQHTELLIRLLEEASRYHGYKDPDARPYFRFHIFGGAVVQPATPPPLLGNGTYDFEWIYAQYNICALAQTGQIDEVWLWDAGQGGFPEWTVRGPEWNATNGVYNPPNCGVQLVTMVFNYDREIDVALHSFNHRIEGMASRYFRCDLFTETWPWLNNWSGCNGLASDRYGFVARPSAANGFVGACGDVHHPPNITDAHDYDYYSMVSSQTICEDWSQDGSAAIQTVTCERWGCTHAGFQIWWLQNMPGYNSTNRNRNGQPMPNWLAYLFGSP